MKHSVVARALLSVVAATLASCATPSRPSASLPSALAPSSDAIVESYGSLLDKYVTPEGVRYHDWVQSEIDLAQLKEVTDYYANNQPPAAETEALAWHLNAYNAWILQRIFDNWPNKGPLDVNLFFFHKKSITVSGERISLLHLENQIIRHRYDDPRIHFALNCASQSCPPLHDEPFRARDLDGTLQRLTVEFLNENPEATLSGEKGNVSRIQLAAQCQSLVALSAIVEGVLKQCFRIS